MSVSIFPPSQSITSAIDDHSRNTANKLLSLNNISYHIGRHRLLSHIDIDIAVNETLSLIGQKWRW